MKQVVVVKLVPNADAHAALAETLRLCSEEANRIATVAFAHRDQTTGQVEREYALRGRVYADAKATGIGSQVAQQVVKKVRSAYAVVYAQVRAGLLRGERATKALAKPIRFKAMSAQPFDDRSLSWDLDAQTVSIRTAAGRVKDIRFACSREHLALLRAHRKGESDLMVRGTTLYLAATIDLPEAAQREPLDFIGVDRGIVNLATTSDGMNFKGDGLERYRRRMARVRAELQAKATKAAKKRLKQRSRREARHASHVNHRISKEIVSARRTHRSRYRPRRPRRHPRAGTAHTAPARQDFQLAVPPIGAVHRIQGPSCRCTGRRGRRPAHQPALSAVRAHQTGEPKNER